MLMKIYEKKVEKEIEKVPKHIVVISPDFDSKKFMEFLNWCEKFGVREVTLCLHEDLKLDLRGVRIRKIHDGHVLESGEGKIIVNLIANFDGKKEITNAIKKLAEKVLNGELDPEKIDEKSIESYLAVKSSPDMIVKVGKDLPEFLIWQSIYSELYFADTEWKQLRYVDFLRMLREYQRRERRYGR